jgi:Xaa-Pro aminopeptidase
MNIDTGANRWCILRTAGPRTLELTTSLQLAGYAAWTPRRTTKQPKRGVKVRHGVKRPMVEVDLPILPTFVFVRANQLSDLVIAAAHPTQPHPAFSIFHFAGRVPLVSDRDVAGLQEEERLAAELIAQLRECEDREERRKMRAAALRNEKARRRAMRMERREFAVDTAVEVTDMPALAGMSGIIKSTDGRSAIVDFGGSLVMKVEAWQLSPLDILKPALAA